MKIVSYPHPTLRHKSKPLKRVDAELKQMVRQMFEAMYESNGVGLAANQVDLPFRLFVANLKLENTEGEELVFINPVISRPKGMEEKEEGCLSLPGLYAPVRRPEKVIVSAYNLQGQEFEAALDGLLARVVQHETDHLDGVLFIDRLSETTKMAVSDEVDEFERKFQTNRELGMIGTDEEIATRLVALEDHYC